MRHLCNAIHFRLYHIGDEHTQQTEHNRSKQANAPLNVESAMTVIPPSCVE